MQVLPLPSRCNFPLPARRQNLPGSRSWKTLAPHPTTKFLPISSRKCSGVDPYSINDGTNDAGSSASPAESVSGDGVLIEIHKTGRNSRRIFSRIRINASLETVWRLLTDYERLADFIPGLATSQLLEKRKNFAKLFQIGQQNLALGLKFNAKGIVECYEGELLYLPSCRQRDIDFKMIEGDFQIFEGKWSIIQADGSEQDDSIEIQEFPTTLSYMVNVQPKLWLPVQLVEGRLSKEVQLNLRCIREAAQKAILDASPNC